jgi:FkbM family methyltransferase
MKIISDILHQYRILRYPQYKKKHAILAEKKRLLAMPRYTQGVFQLQNRPVKFLDAASFYFMYQEIFETEIYKFTSRHSNPLIIDAGANIGLSVIYFKKNFPNATVIAFEPDQKVFDVLEENVRTFGLKNVILERKALWNDDTSLNFRQEGADAGHVLIDKNEPDDKYLVPAVRLKNYLNTRIDFLKMDIEGAEVAVILDCAAELRNVDRLFVEYHSFVGQEQMLPELLATLKMAGFRLNINTPGLSSKSPFFKLETYSSMDMQLNIYAFRN